MSVVGFKQHQLYHEAQRRVKQAQPLVLYTDEQSLLLPAPNNIIFELFNTIVAQISSDSLLEYVSNNMAEYLTSTWSTKITQRAVKRLRREQTLDIKAGLLSSAPLIRLSRLTAGGKARSPSKSPADNSKVGSRESQPASRARQKSPPLNYRQSDAIALAVQQVHEHLMWRIHNNNVTQITSLLIKLMLDDGYKRGKLKAEAYDDVAPSLEDWRAQKLIKLYAFGNAPASDQKLILASTSSGDLTRWIANYIDGSEKQLRVDLLRKLAGALRDKTKNCIYLTNELNDALMSLKTDAIRCALLVDRARVFEHPNEKLDTSTCDLLREGKLYIVASLKCIQFAPDPAAESCC